MITIRSYDGSVYLVEPPLCFAVHHTKEEVYDVVMNAPCEKWEVTLFRGTKQDCEDILQAIWVEVEDGAVIDIANLAVEAQEANEQMEAKTNDSHL